MSGDIKISSGSVDKEELSLTINAVATREFAPNILQVILQTSRGDIECLFHPCQGGTGGVIWVCGSLGGYDGPSFGIFSSLSKELVADGISSLRLHYRVPGNLEECALDVLAGVSFLKSLGIEGIALVGHSFGGAVVIMAGAFSPDVKAVVGLSSQTYGAQGVAKVAPKPLLLIHGKRDRNLSVQCSELIYEWAKEPKELVIYQDSGHFLRECHQELHDLLKKWLVERVGREDK